MFLKTKLILLSYFNKKTELMIEVLILLKNFY